MKLLSLLFALGSFVCGIAYVTGIVVSGTHGHVLLAVVDFFIPPVGVVDGLTYWWGWLKPLW